MADALPTACVETSANRNDSIVASPVTGSSLSNGGALSDVNTISGNNALADTSMADNSFSHRRSAFDFAEEIRRLEIEGDKLRAATISSLSNIGPPSSRDVRDSTLEGDYMPLSVPSLPPFSSFMDISSEQKTISDLRTQLESQRKETARLQKQLLGDMSVGMRGLSSSINVSQSHYLNSSSSSSPIANLSSSSSNGFPLSMSSPSKSMAAFSTIPSSEIGNSFTRRQFDSEPPSHLERSLKESQEQVIDLKKKLQETNDLSDQQKKQFRTAIEELKSKLHETILNRDTVLDLRQKESNQQDILLEKLQSSLNQLQEQYRIQEEALAAASKKLDSQSQHNYAHQTAINQIRSVLVERERRRGSCYFDSDPAGTQSVSMLAHTLERCFQEMDHDMNVVKYKVSGLESDLEQHKKLSAEKDRKTSHDFEEKLKSEADDAVKKISVLSAEHDKNMSIASEQIRTAKQQLSEYQSQMYEKESHYVQERQEKDSIIRDLEDRLEEHNKRILEERTRWQEKLIEAKHDHVSTERMRVAIEASLDEVQKELVETKAEKNDFIQKHACLETQLADVQSLVTRLEADLTIERERVREQRTREEQLRTQVLNLETQVSNKQGDVDRLERMLDVVKQECSLQVVDKVASAERLERDRFLDQIKSLSAQLTTMTEKCNRVTVEHQMSKSEMDSQRSQVLEMTEKMERARSQVETALSEKHELTSLLGDKAGDLDRLIRDKEHFSQLAEERSIEIRDLKVSEARLKLQLEEREKVLSTFSQQSNSINQLMEVHSRSNDNIREEKDRLSMALMEKTTQYEEMKTSHDASSRKLKTKEKRIRDLEEERLKVNEDLAVKCQELELLQQEKDGILSELKESRLEVAGLSSSKDTLKKELLRVKNLRTKEINKLQTRLKDAEQESRLTQKALRSKDIIDQKAVRFADRAQKEITVKRSEVDILASKLHRLEEKLQTTTREKSMVEKDKDSLKKSLAKSLLHTQELTDELQTTQGQNQELIRRVADLEMAMDKAVIKSSAAAAQLDKCEQDMAMVKIKHQLELKEAERQFARGAQSGFYSYGSSIPSSLPSMLPERDLNPPPSQRKETGRLERDDDSSAMTSDVQGSEASKRKSNTLEIRDKRHREYSEVGRDLKNLLSDMRNLISSHRESEDDVTASSNLRSSQDRHRDARTDKPRVESDKLPLSARSTSYVDEMRRSPDNIRDSSLYKSLDLDKSWASKSFSELDNLSDFSVYKDWQPRAHSLTRHKSWGSDLDSTHNTTYGTRNTYTDFSRLSQSMGSPHKERTGISTGVPDTKELCRRLEDKINSLTRMGGNLQKENREMASLIDRQGEKLDTVKQNEKKVRETKVASARARESKVTSARQSR